MSIEFLHVGRLRRALRLLLFRQLVVQLVKL